MDTPSHTALGREILSTVRSDLYLSLRFLDAALSGLTFEMSPLIPSSATAKGYTFSPTISSAHTMKTQFL